MTTSCEKILNRSNSLPVLWEIRTLLHLNNRGLYRTNQYRPRIDTNLFFNHLLLMALQARVHKDEYHRSTSHLYRR